MQINYHFSPTKIQKLQNLKKKKKKILYQSILPKIGRYGRYLNRYETLIFWYRYTYRYGTGTILITLVPKLLLGTSSQKINRLTCSSYNVQLWMFEAHIDPCLFFSYFILFYLRLKRIALCGFACMKFFWIFLLLLNLFTNPWVWS